MKRRTRKHLTIAAAFIVSAFCTGIPAAGRLPAVYAEDAQETALPDWIPDTYGKALHFMDTYGGTHIEDGLLCVVFHEEQYSGPEGLVFQHTVTAEGDAVQELYHETHHYYDTTGSPYYVWDFEVFVYRPVCAGDFAVSLATEAAEDVHLPDQAAYVPAYRFSVDEQLRITETDPYSWVPDCPQEYEDFQLENGKTAAYGNQIAVCLNYSLMAANMGKYQYTEALSSDAVRRIGLWSCAGKETAERGRTGPAWVSYQEIAVYEAVSDGDAEITWELKDKDGNPYTAEAIGGYVPENASQKVSGVFRITDNAQTVLGAGDARVSFVNAETGAPLAVNAGSGLALYRLMENSDAKPLIARLPSNPSAVRKLSKYMDDDALSLDAASFALAAPSAYGIPAENRGTVTKYDNGSYDVEFRLQCDAAGDVNRDRVFSDGDAEALIRWLTAQPELQIADWAAADCDRNNMLSAADLTLMKRKLLAPGTAGEDDIITAATKMPVIVDETGTITDSMKAKLEKTVRELYPGSDLSDFRLVYDPEHPLTEKAGGPCFYVYYQDTLVHGLGNLDLRNNVYAAFDKSGKVTLQLLASPEAFLSVDLSGEDLSESMMNGRQKGSTVDRIIYAKRDDKETPLRVAYRVLRSDVPLEEIRNQGGGVIVTIDHTPPKKDTAA